MEKKGQTKTIAYMAMYVALYVLLKFVGNMIPFLQMPNGGSIELELVALFVASYHLGAKNGVLVAGLSLLLQFALGFNFYIVSFMQFLLDYALPIVVVGACASYFKKGTKSYYYITVVIAMILKWLCNVLSGVYYWPPEDGAAGSSIAWAFSVGYNTPYNLATLVVCLILVPLLVQRLKKSNINFIA